MKNKKTNLEKNKQFITGVELGQQIAEKLKNENPALFVKLTDLFKDLRKEKK